MAKEPVRVLVTGAAGGPFHCLVAQKAISVLFFFFSFFFVASHFFVLVAFLTEKTEGN